MSNILIELLEVAEKFRNIVQKNSIAYNVTKTAIQNYYKTNDNANELLEIAEMYRDTLKSNSEDKEMLNQVIKKYYKTHPCPHRLQVIKVIKSACGCKTTVTICIDCDKIMSEEKTDC